MKNKKEGKGILKWTDNSCEYQLIEGCTDSDAKNYDSEAEIDDGSCEYYVEGCTDKDAKNWNPDAEIEDGSCEYYVEGCMDVNATNYNSTAEIDDGSCEYPEPDPVEGCVDVNATNYNSNADIDDGSCEYPEVSICVFDIIEYSVIFKMVMEQEGMLTVGMDIVMDIQYPKKNALAVNFTHYLMKLI